MKPARAAAPRERAGIPPIVGAVAGAAVGALAWGLITHFTGYEVGYVAWGIGAAVGWGAAVLGGRGSAMGMTCAALALAAILCGKMLAVNLVHSSNLDAWFGEPPSRDSYDLHVQEANEFVEADSDTAIRGFMIENGYTEADAVPEIDDEELAAFQERHAPSLLAFHEQPPSFEDWQTEQQAEADVMRGILESDFSPLEVVTEDLSPIDLLFAGLGVFTAFKMGSGNTPEPPARRRSDGQSARIARKRE